MTSPEQQQVQKQPTRYVLAFVHPEDDGIEQTDLMRFLNELNKIDSPKERTAIDLLLNSTGGDIYAAYKIICLLRSKCSNMQVVIPLYAKSAATLMALGADKIVLAPQSELGPLDAPMEHPLVEGIHLSALDGVRPLEFLSDFCSHLALEVLGVRIRTQVGLGRKDSVDLALRFAGQFVKPIVGKLDPLVINMCYRRLQIAERYGRELLTEYMFKNKTAKEALAQTTIRELVWHYPEHGYAICCNEARRLNLEIVEKNTFNEWNRFWNLFLSLNQENKKVIRLIPQEIFESIPNTISVEGQTNAGQAETG